MLLYMFIHVMWITNILILLLTYLRQKLTLHLCLWKYLNQCENMQQMVRVLFSCYGFFHPIYVHIYCEDYYNIIIFTTSLHNYTCIHIYDIFLYLHYIPIKMSLGVLAQMLDLCTISSIFQRQSYDLWYRSPHTFYIHWFYSLRHQFWFIWLK